MIKVLMGLVTTISSFLGLLGINNSAFATPLIQSEFDSVVTNSLETVNLNLSGSLWQLDSQSAKTIFDHLGCTCAACSSQGEINNSL